MADTPNLVGPRFEIHLILGQDENGQALMLTQGVQLDGAGGARSVDTPEIMQLLLKSAGVFIGAHFPEAPKSKVLLPTMPMGRG